MLVVNRWEEVSRFQLFCGCIIVHGAIQQHDCNPYKLSLKITTNRQTNSDGSREERKRAAVADSTSPVEIWSFHLSDQEERHWNKSITGRTYSCRLKKGRNRRIFISNIQMKFHWQNSGNSSSIIVKTVTLDLKKTQNIDHKPGVCRMPVFLSDDRDGKKWLHYCDMLFRGPEEETFHLLLQTFWTNQLFGSSAFCQFMTVTFKWWHITPDSCVHVFICVHVEKTVHVGATHCFISNVYNKLCEAS